ncbi:MAG: hypothetical protein BAJALOKI1v1_480014 [Promethearchaeota archaeon]|nr:MAG: hypothetical protein BAJALOKI1v1_480014 [Candidatus Lokiarchaeota archaeon]
MKKHPLIFIIIFSCISFAFLPSFLIEKSVAYYGDGDCGNYHGITYIEVPKDSDAEIVLDGKNDESFWHESSNQKGFKSIPLSEQRGGEIPKIHTLNITFIMTSEYLYIYCEWKDTSEYFEFPPDKDGLSFCWDKNTKSFSAYYTSHMDTVDMGGGIVDLWNWVYDSDKNPGENYFCDDNSFDEGGFNGADPKDVEVAYEYTAGKETYSLEIKRKLITNDAYDVQFTSSRWLYKFNLAIYNDSHGSDHAISWTYALNTNPLMQYLPLLIASQYTEKNEISGFFIVSVLIAMSIISSLIIVKIQIKKHSIRNEN